MVGGANNRVKIVTLKDVYKARTANVTVPASLKS